MARRSADRRSVARRHAAGRACRRRVPRGDDRATVARHHAGRPRMAARRRVSARPVRGNRRYAAAACVRALACAHPGAAGNGRGSPAAAGRCPGPAKPDATAPPRRECDRRKWSGGGRDRISPPRRRAAGRRPWTAPLAVPAAAQGHGAALEAAAGRDSQGAAPERRPVPAARNSAVRNSAVRSLAVRSLAGRRAPAARWRFRRRGRRAVAPRLSEPARWASAAVRAGPEASSPRVRAAAQPVAGVAVPDAVRRRPRQGGTRAPVPPRPTRTRPPRTACA